LWRGPSSLSEKPKNGVIEIRNHLLSTYNLKQEIDLDYIKIHRILLKDTIVLDDRIQHSEEFRVVQECAGGFILPSIRYY